MKNEIPVQKNEEYEIEIENFGVNGEGIGRIDGYTLFIDNALPGEFVRIKVLKTLKNYGYAKILKILKSSPYRVEPRCPYQKRCGGCQLQHMNYELQLKFKTQLVNDALKRIAKLDNVMVLPAIGLHDPFRYRNKAQFPVGQGREGIAIGFFAPRSHDIVNIESCGINHPVNDKVIKVFKEYIEKYNISLYDEKTHKGILRHIVTKVGFNSAQVMVVVVTNGSEISYKEQLIHMLRENIPSISSVVQNINSSKTNVILGMQNISLWGENYIIDTIGKLKFKISPLSFFQVNPVQTRVLYDKVVEYAKLSGKETVLDAYSGIGTISLFLSQKAKKVYGIEVVKPAVADAKENARINNIDNVEFIEGEAEKIIPKMVDEGFRPDVIVVDPPRKGCDQHLLEAMIKADPDRIVYVSCNPATLARDLKYLSENGYNPIQVQPVDMFPETSHVECVVGMQRKDT